MIGKNKIEAWQARREKGRFTIMEDIINIINEPYKDKIRKRKPDFHRMETVFKPKYLHDLLIDMPIKSGNWHGSSYLIDCESIPEFPRLKCYIEGDVIVHPDVEDDTKKEIEKTKCKVYDVHRHRMLLDESHVHFICENKDVVDTKEIMKKLRWF